MKLLKTENEILKDQLKKGGERSGVSEKPEFIHPGSSDTRSLLTLTKKLQDAQKLYEHLKNDMAKVNEVHIFSSPGLSICPYPLRFHYLL